MLLFTDIFRFVYVLQGSGGFGFCTKPRQNTNKLGGSHQSRQADPGAVRPRRDAYARVDGWTSAWMNVKNAWGTGAPCVMYVWNLEIWAPAHRSKGSNSLVEVSTSSSSGSSIWEIRVMIVICGLRGFVCVFVCACLCMYRIFACVLMISMSKLSLLILGLVILATNYWSSQIITTPESGYHTSHNIHEGLRDELLAVRCRL